MINNFFVDLNYQGAALKKPPDLIIPWIIDNSRFAKSIYDKELSLKTSAQSSKTSAQSSKTPAQSSRALGYFKSSRCAFTVEISCINVKSVCLVFVQWHG